MAHLERLNEIIAGHPNRTTIIIDEIQKVPELLSAGAGSWKRYFAEVT